MTDRLDPSRPTSHDALVATREIKDKQDEIAFGHDLSKMEWDGIRELDYPPPRWWVLTFFGCILFAVLWWILYPAWPTPFGTTPGLLRYSSREAVTRVIAEAEQQRQPLVNAIGSGDLDAIRSDPDLMNFALHGGQVAFNNNCAPCHGLGGAGQGFFPSLADDDWLWGGAPADIEYTIRHGIRNGGEGARESLMPSFGADGILTRDQVRDVAEYVLSLSHRSQDTAAVERGAPLFAENCVACHGEGGVGNHELGAPALNDAIWLYGGDRAHVTAQINRPHLGVMPAFGARLDDATVKMLVLYVHSLGGGQ